MNDATKSMRHPSGHRLYVSMAVYAVHALEGGSRYGAVVGFGRDGAGRYVEVLFTDGTTHRMGISSIEIGDEDEVRDYTLAGLRACGIF